MAYRWVLYLMITTTAAYPAAPLDLPPLGQTGLTDASMNNNNNNNNNIPRVNSVDIRVHQNNRIH